jgi:hypothetical protein
MGFFDRGLPMHISGGRKIPTSTNNTKNHAKLIETLNRHELSEEKVLFEQMTNIEKDNLTIINELRETSNKLKFGNVAIVVSNAINKYITMNQKLDRNKRLDIYLEKINAKIAEIERLIETDKADGNLKEDIKVLRAELEQGRQQLVTFKHEVGDWNKERAQELKTVLLQVTPQNVMKNLTKETYGERWNTPDFKEKYNNYYASVRTLMAKLINSVKLDEKDIENFNHTCDDVSNTALKIEKELDYERMSFRS